MYYKVRWDAQLAPINPFSGTNGCSIYNFEFHDGDDNDKKWIIGAKARSSLGIKHRRFGMEDGGWTSDAFSQSTS